MVDPFSGGVPGGFLDHLGEVFRGQAQPVRVKSHLPVTAEQTGHLMDKEIENVVIALLAQVFLRGMPAKDVQDVVDHGAHQVDDDLTAHRVAGVGGLGFQDVVIFQDAQPFRPVEVHVIEVPLAVVSRDGVFDHADDILGGAEIHRDENTGKILCLADQLDHIVGPDNGHIPRDGLVPLHIELECDLPMQAHRKNEHLRPQGAFPEKQVAYLVEDRKIVADRNDVRNILHKIYAKSWNFCTFHHLKTDCRIKLSPLCRNRQAKPGKKRKIEQVSGKTNPSGGFSAG